MEAGIERKPARGLWLVLGLVLLLRIPFLNQAIQGDDDIYLTEAAHALVEPLHPDNVKYVFRGDVVDLRGQSHPPLDAWPLAALITAFGDVKEIPFHAAYTIFSVIAVCAMWSLAGRFSPRPIWATLLFIAVPAFVVNGNSLESDLPFLAFWMAAIALFCADRLWLATAAMALASLGAYQAVFLTPILAAYVWLYRRRERTAWVVTLTPLVTLAAWQVFDRSASGAMPASVLMGYFSHYGFQALRLKILNAEALSVHLWFIVFPALVPAAAILAWRKRRETDTWFLCAWIAIFFTGALAVLFAGSARYLLPIAAPVALLASRLRPRWLAVGFAAQLALGLGLAAVNYQHWDGYRKFAQAWPGHRVWVNGEWGLRYYLEARGALPLSKTEHVRPGDIVVSSELAHPVEVTAPVTVIATKEIGSGIPLRLIALDSHSGYSSASKGILPFGISDGAIDRVRAELIGERHPKLEFLSLGAPGAAEQIVSGIFAADHWMSRSGVVVLKSPRAAVPLRVRFFIPDNAPARRVALLLDGREVAAQTYANPGSYMLESAPVLPGAAVATVEIDVDKTFSAPPDTRDLGVVLIGVGFSILR